MTKHLLDGRSLTVECLEAIALGEGAELHADARVQMVSRARQFDSRNASEILRRKWSWLGAGQAPADGEVMVRAFIEGHCGAVGDPLEPVVVRAMMAARVNILATGYAGVRPEVADVLLAMLNANVVPVVPSQGSVGAAAPSALAHVMRVACRYGGRAWREGVELSADEAMAGLPVMQLDEHEALASINGATLTTALGALCCARARRLLQTSISTCALSFDVCTADLHCLDAEAMAARGHPGAIYVAKQLRRLLKDSELVTSGRKPDPFSIRCAPIVLGSAWEALAHVRGIVERELNAAAINPLVLADGRVVEAGNFHGAPVALAMDHLKVALTQVASISERRTFRMTYGQLSGLPSFLLKSTGLNSGLMLAQYTAASLVSECKGWAHPASVDSIPTVQHHEDHASMGAIAGRGTLIILDLLADVLAIELLCGAQGLDFHLAGERVGEDGELVSVAPRRPGERAREVYQDVRSLVPRWQDDRVLHPDLAALGAAVRQGLFSELEQVD